MLRLRTLITKTALVKLCSILPHFQYCSSVWHLCGARNAAKVENLNKTILRLILGDFDYDILLDEVNCVSLYNRRVHNTLILLYKVLFLTKYPIYMKNMFNLRFSSYNLRRNYTYGLHSFSYHAAKQWELLSDPMRTSDFSKFNKHIASLYGK